MIDLSKTPRLKALSRRFTQTVVPALAATALFASAQPAHAVSKAVKAFRTAVATLDIEAISGAAGSAALANKYQDAKNFVKYSVQAINAKTTGSNVTPLNKQEEIAEVVAIVVAKVNGNSKLTKLNKIRSTIRSIMQQAFKFAGPLTVDLVRDVAASTALTVSNSTAQAVNVTGIQSYLTKFAGKSSLLGTKANAKNPANVTAVNLGLTQGFDKTGAGVAFANVHYEDGNIPDLMNIADAETDKRPA